MENTKTSYESLKFICGIHSGPRAIGRPAKKPCNKRFGTLKELAWHINQEHRIEEKINEHTTSSNTGLARN